MYECVIVIMYVNVSVCECEYMSGSMIVYTCMCMLVFEL